MKDKNGRNLQAGDVVKSPNGRLGILIRRGDTNLETSQGYRDSYTTVDAEEGVLDTIIPQDWEGYTPMLKVIKS